MSQSDNGLLIFNSSIGGRRTASRRFRAGGVRTIGIGTTISSGTRPFGANGRRIDSRVGNCTRSRCWSRRQGPWRSVRPARDRENTVFSASCRSGRYWIRTNLKNTGKTAFQNQPGVEMGAIGNLPEARTRHQERPNCSVCGMVSTNRAEIDC